MGRWIFQRKREPRQKHRDGQVRIKCRDEEESN